jgi:hypothetical protein
MRKGISLSALIVIALVAAAPVAAAPVLVTVTGQVEYNFVSSPPLADAMPGDPVTLTFTVDSDTFTDSGSFPVRGYEINPMSFSLQLGTISMTLQDPFPAGQTPWFVIRDNDPAVDGFYLSALTIDFPLGVPINQSGFFGQFHSYYSVTYLGDTLSSLDILDALGIYDFNGLTVFGFRITDGPFDPIGLIFESMTIEAIPVDDDGDGVVNADDLCPDTVIPESVPTIHLGTNRWALVDDDLVFDTEMPPGGGPGFAFDTEDTGGCSCEQIIEQSYLGLGHTKFGCSNSAMLEWVDMVAGSGYVADSASGPGAGGLSSTATTAGLQDVLLRSGDDGRVTTGSTDENPGDRLSGASTTSSDEQPRIQRSRTARPRR